MEAKYSIFDGAEESYTEKADALLKVWIGGHYIVACVIIVVLLLLVIYLYLKSMKAPVASAYEGLAIDQTAGHPSAGFDAGAATPALTPPEDGNTCGNGLNYDADQAYAYLQEQGASGDNAEDAQNQHYEGYMDEPKGPQRDYSGYPGKLENGYEGAKNKYEKAKNKYEKWVPGATRQDQLSPAALTAALQGGKIVPNGGIYGGY